MPVAESDGTKRAGQQAMALRRTLHERGLRMTPQRQLVLNAVRALGHATPEQVCTQVQREAPAVNITTVYRSLDLLERLGLVRHTHLGHGAPTTRCTSTSTCTWSATAAAFSPRSRSTSCPDSPSGWPWRPVSRWTSRTSRSPGTAATAGTGSTRDRARHPRADIPGPDIPGPDIPGPDVSEPDVSEPDLPDPDSAVPAHRGDFLAEQRAMARAAAVVDRSHRGVLAVPGDDRLTWLHLLLTQHVSELPDGAGTEALVLDVNGRVLHHAVVAHVGTTVWLDTEPGYAPVLLDYLEKMRFWSKVEPRDATDELAVLSVVGPGTPAVLDRVGAPLPGPAYGVAPCRAAGSCAGCRGPARTPRIPLFPVPTRTPGSPGSPRPARTQPGRWRSRRSGWRRCSHGCTSTRTAARSRTRSAGSRRPCT